MPGDPMWGVAVSVTSINHVNFLEELNKKMKRLENKSLPHAPSNRRTEAVYL